jgi:hypothetical protein
MNDLDIEEGTVAAVNPKSDKILIQLDLGGFSIATFGVDSPPHISLRVKGRLRDTGNQTLYGCDNEDTYEVMICDFDVEPVHAWRFFHTP